ncbi:MAG: hypothetical protein PVG83_09775 [Acidimicrobiia bacterium]
MRLLKSKWADRELTWKVCLNCGNRYQAGDHGYRVRWCSPSCETATMRSQREEIESSWMRAVWFIR